MRVESASTHYLVYLAGRHNSQIAVLTERIWRQEDSEAKYLRRCAVLPVLKRKQERIRIELDFRVSRERQHIVLPHDAYSGV